VPHRLLQNSRRGAGRHFSFQMRLFSFRMYASTLASPTITQASTAVAIIVLLTSTSGAPLSVSSEELSLHRHILIIHIPPAPGTRVDAVFMSAAMGSFDGHDSCTDCWCRQVKSNGSELQTCALTIVRFDEYSHVSFSTRQARCNRASAECTFHHLVSAQLLAQLIMTLYIPYMM
jgi:hypothetical protein